MIHHGDLFDVLPTLEPDSIDACVTDPPYGLEFMGKDWDKLGAVGKQPKLGKATGDPHRRHTGTPSFGANGNPSCLNCGGDKYRNGPGKCVCDAPNFGNHAGDQSRIAQEWHERWAREVYRVLKPGAHLLAFGGSRTFHRMTCAIEDAGFEIRDCLSWLYGQGFPKSLNLGDGRGTALKPAFEPVVMARKPLIGTVAQNVAQHGTGAINVDACRIRFGGPCPTGGGSRESWRVMEARDDRQPHNGGNVTPDTGRWPANVVLDEEAAALLDEQTGDLDVCGGPKRTTHDAGMFGIGQPGRIYPDVGGASRFFYCSKPSREERDYGCEGLTARSGGEATDRTDGSAGINSPRAGAGRTGGSRNIHPTVKPVELMRWLVKLVTPPDGVVLDPFTGSGTTGMACRYELRQFVGIEREADYIAIAERRIAAVVPLFAELTG